MRGCFIACTVWGLRVRGFFGVGLSGYNFDGCVSVDGGSVPKLTVAVGAPYPSVTVDVYSNVAAAIRYYPNEFASA